MGQAWVSVHPMGDVRTHACLSCPVSSLSFGHSQVDRIYGNSERNPPKTNLEKLEITGLDRASLIRLRASQRESRGTGSILIL